MRSLKPRLDIRHVQVQTVNWCNRSCSFCPSNKFELERDRMSGTTYARILEGLGAIGFKGRFSPYLMNEPLLDPRLPEMIAQARQALPESIVAIQTNGDRLTPKAGARLFSKGLHKLIVNGYDLEPPRRLELTKLISNLAESVPGLKRVGYGLSLMTHPGRKDRDRPEAALVVRNGLNPRSLTNRAGNLPHGMVLKEPLKAPCQRPFRQLYFRFNGDAVLCCCDWKGEVVLGNINSTDLAEIIASETARRYRRHLARSDRSLKLCNQCDYRGRDLTPQARLVNDFRVWLGNLGQGTDSP